MVYCMSSQKYGMGTLKCWAEQWDMVACYGPGHNVENGCIVATNSKFGYQPNVMAEVVC